MMRTPYERSSDWFLLASLALAALLLGNDGGFVSGPLFKLVRSLLFPAHAFVASTSDIIAETTAGLLQAPSLKAELEDLKARVEAAEALEVRLREVELENERLRTLLATFPRLPKGSIPAAVVSYSPLEVTAILSAGSKHGVRMGAPVVSPKGLVGVVDQVDTNSCRVVFTTSARFAAGARVAGAESRASGVVRGTGGDRLLLDHLPENSLVAVGDHIVTSGIGARYPKGILIGTVTRVWRDPSYGFLRAWVNPAVRHDTVEEAVILP